MNKELRVLLNGILDCVDDLCDQIESLDNDLSEYNYYDSDKCSFERKKIRELKETLENLTKGESNEDQG